MLAAESASKGPSLSEPWCRFSADALPPSPNYSQFFFSSLTDPERGMCLGNYSRSLEGLIFHFPTDLY